MFGKPTAIAPRKRLIAPASFSRQSATLEFSGLVAGSDIVEDAHKRSRRLRRPGSVATKQNTSDTGGVSRSNDAQLASILGDPWYTMTKTEIYIAEKIKSKKDRRLKDKKLELGEQEAERRAAEEKRVHEEEEARRLVAMQGAGTTVMPKEVNKVVVIKKMRDKDIRLEMAELDKALEFKKKKKSEDKKTLKSAIELIKLKEEELNLTRERMVHVYRAAQDAILSQSQDVVGTEDAELLAFINRNSSYNSAGTGEMITIKSMKQHVDVYSKYERIEDLWQKLRDYAHMVGKVQIARRRRAAFLESKSRLNYHKAITDTLLAAAMGEVSYPDSVVVSSISRQKTPQLAQISHQAMLHNAGTDSPTAGILHKDGPAYTSTGSKDRVAAALPQKIWGYAKATAATAALPASVPATGGAISTKELDMPRNRSNSTSSIGKFGSDSPTADKSHVYPLH